MLELNLYKNSNTYSKQFGKYYARVENKRTLSIHDMALHMAEHNTPFSVGTIEGILRDFVNCTREQCLNGNTVKVDNLAIFSASIMANPLTIKKGMKLVATLGQQPTNVTEDTVQPAVKSAKLLARATGEFRREELNKDGKFRWTSKAAEFIKSMTGEQDSPADNTETEDENNG